METSSSTQEDAHTLRLAPIAVVMITLNEAHNLDAVLRNLLGWASEVFIVDSYSRDATVDIALRHGVHVVQRAFRDFGDQWNFALRELPIKSPWTMKLDPDERLTEELKRDIEAQIATGTADGFSVVRRLWFMGRALPVKHSLVRVWRTGSCRFTDVSVNEYPIVTGQVRHLAAELEHHDSPNLEHWLDKQNRYTTMEAIHAFRGEQLAARAKLFGSHLERRMWLKKHYMKLPGRYTLLFLYHYLALGAWRAGWVGYAWSRLRSDVYRLVEYKLREMILAERDYVQPVRGPGDPDPRVRQY